MSLKRRYVAITCASVLLSSAAGCDGCRRSQRVDPLSLVDASVTTPAPRCTLLPTAMSMPADVVDVGVARAQGSIVVMGITQKSGEQRTAAIVKLDTEAGQLTVVPLGAQHDDDLPPRAAFGSQGVVAAFVSADGDGRAPKPDEAKPGALVVGSIAGTTFTAIGKPLRGMRSSGASSFDLAERDGLLLLAATSDGARENRVVVTDVRGGNLVSSVISDAPFVEEIAFRAEASGFALAWAAVRVHYDDAGDRLEGPGIERSDRWVEGTKLDAKGACVKQPCAPVRLSKGSGHIGYFELPIGNDAPTIYFRDDEERQVGQGSEIYLRKWGGALPEAPTTIRAGGVGIRAFDALSPTFVAYTNVHEEVQIAKGGSSGAEWLAPDAGGVDIHDGLLSSDVRLLAALPAKPPSAASSSLRLLALRGREILQLSCTP